MMQKWQLFTMMVQVKDLERLLSEADRERREVREKYVALGRRVDTLQGSEEALRYGIQVGITGCCPCSYRLHRVLEKELPLI